MRCFGAFRAAGDNRPDSTASRCHPGESSSTRWTHGRQHVSLRRRRYTPQPRVAALRRTPWGIVEHALDTRPPTCVLTPKALHPTAQGRGASPAPWGIVEHAGHTAANMCPYAEGVTPHSPGSRCLAAHLGNRRARAGHTAANMCPYAEGVTPHSPGSRRARGRHPGESSSTRLDTRPPTCVLTPKALHPTAQGRGACAAPWGIVEHGCWTHGRQHVSLRRRRYTPQPRVAAPCRAPWGTDDHTYKNPNGVLQPAATARCETPSAFGLDCHR